MRFATNLYFSVEFSMFAHLPVVSEGSKPLPASTRAKAGTFAYHDKAASRAQTHQEFSDEVNRCST
jgi:hypothetical protein